MKNKVISSLREVDWKEIPVPLVVIYKNPLGFPEECVARVFDAKNRKSNTFLYFKKNSKRVQGRSA